MQRNSELQPNNLINILLITNYFAKFFVLGYAINNNSKVAKTENISMNLKKAGKTKML